VRRAYVHYYATLTPFPDGFRQDRHISLAYTAQPSTATGEWFPRSPDAAFPFKLPQATQSLGMYAYDDLLRLLKPSLRIACSYCCRPRERVVNGLSRIGENTRSIPTHDSRADSPTPDASTSKPVILLSRRRKEASCASERTACATATITGFPIDVSGKRGVTVATGRPPTQCIGKTAA